jgi:hypothetical protein
MSTASDETVLIRNYPKVIFFWPLTLTSFVLWLIQLFAFGDDPNAFLGYFWIAMFFINLFVIAFDFSSAKFFVLILIIVVAILVVIFLFVSGRLTFDPSAIEAFNFGLTWPFYLVMTVVFSFVLFFVFINSRFSYYKIERNEIYHKSGIFASAERYPVSDLRIKKEIPDVFEFLFLRAGSLVLMPGRQEEVIQLPTVLNINNRIEELDRLLSHVSVEPDELD